MKVKGLSDAPVQSSRPPAPQQGPPPLKKARIGTPALPTKPAPLTTSHLANRLTQPRSQPAPVVPRAKPDPVLSESESRDSWSAQHEANDPDVSGDGEELKVYPDTELHTDDDQFAQEQVHYFKFSLRQSSMHQERNC